MKALALLRWQFHLATCSCRARHRIAVPFRSSKHNMQLLQDQKNLFKPAASRPAGRPGRPDKPAGLEAPGWSVCFTIHSTAKAFRAHDTPSQFAVLGALGVVGVASLQLRYASCSCEGSALSAVASPHVQQQSGQHASSLDIISASCAARCGPHATFGVVLLPQQTAVARDKYCAHVSYPLCCAGLSRRRRGMRRCASNQRLQGGMLLSSAQRVPRPEAYHTRLPRPTPATLAKARTRMLRSVLTSPPMEHAHTQQ